LNSCDHGQEHQIFLCSSNEKLFLTNHDDKRLIDTQSSSHEEEIFKSKILKYVEE